MLSLLGKGTFFSNAPSTMYRPFETEKNGLDASKTRKARLARRKFTERKRARANASLTQYCAVYNSFL
jgi:hypothetical protein